MTIANIQEAKELRRHGARIGRAGMSQRAHEIMAEYLSKYPDGNYKEAVRVAGRMHAIYIATNCDDYWREKAQDGYTREQFDISKFEPKPD